MSANKLLPHRTKPLRIGQLRLVDSQTLRPNLKRKVRNIAVAEILSAIAAEGRPDAGVVCSRETFRMRHDYYELEAKAQAADPDGFDHNAFERDFDPELGDWELDRDLYAIEWAIIGHADRKAYGIHNWYNVRINQGAEPWRLSVMQAPCFGGLDRDHAQGHRGARFELLSVLLRHFMLHPFTIRVDGKAQEALVVEWRFSTDYANHRFPTTAPHIAKALERFATIDYSTIDGVASFSKVRTKPAVLRQVVDGDFEDPIAPPPRPAPEPDEEDDIEPESIKEMCDARRGR